MVHLFDARCHQYHVKFIVFVSSFIYTSLFFHSASARKHTYRWLYQADTSFFSSKKREGERASRNDKSKSFKFVMNFDVKKQKPHNARCVLLAQLSWLHCEMFWVLNASFCVGIKHFCLLFLSIWFVCGYKACIIKYVPCINGKGR